MVSPDFPRFSDFTRFQFVNFLNHLTQQPRVAGVALLRSLAVWERITRRGRHDIPKALGQTTGSQRIRQVVPAS